MPTSTQQVVSDGTLLVLNISFNYLDRSEVTVYFNDVLTTAWAWVGTTEKQIQFTSVVPAATVVLLRRTTAFANLRHSFTEGAAFTPKSLDEDLTQVLHVAQEAFEGGLPGEFYTDLNMHSYRIRNVGVAVDDTDVLTLAQYKADALGAWSARTGAELAASAATVAKTAAELAAEQAEAALAVLASPTGANVGYTHSAGVNPTTVQAALRAELVNVWLYFIAGEADATAMFNRASAAARRVYVPAGAYTVANANWPANTTFYGDGTNVTVINQKSGAMYAFTCDSGSSNVLNNIVGLRMENLQVRGTCDSDGFSEHVHLLNLNGVTDVKLRHVLLKGFRGDAIYIGSSNTAEVVRYNRDISVYRCAFDGVNNANRNAISCITVDGITVDGCDFHNCTAPTMPGAIDFEPNPTDTLAEVKNGTVKHCRFSNIGGNVGVISVFTPSTIVAPVSNMRFLHNKCSSSNTFLALLLGKAPTETSDTHDVISEGNSTNSGLRPFILSGVKGFRSIRDTFTDYTHSAFIGYTGAADACMDVDVRGTRFIRCGSVEGVGLSVFTVQRLGLRHCTFLDCAAGTPGASVAITFNVGTSSYVTIEGTRIASPLFLTAVAIQKEAGHTFTPSTNVYARNDTALYSNSFQAEDSDAFDTSYTPVVAGDASTGTGTYTGLVGKFTRKGKHVQFWVEGNVSAGHTGTGGILVTLPYPCVDRGNGEQVPVALSVTGVVTSGGHVGLIHPYVTVAGKGCVRLFQDGAGVRTQINMPAGAFTFNVAGSYTTT